MLRPAARDEEQGVDPHIVASAHVTWREALGGDSDAAKPIAVESECSRFVAGPGLHLDKSQGSTAASDDIDFSPRNPRAPRQDSPTFEAQVPAGKALGSTPAAFRLLPVHFCESSSARA